MRSEYMVSRNAQLPLAINIVALQFYYENSESLL